MVEYEVDVFSDDDDDEEMEILANVLYRRPYTVRQRPNHLEFWDDTDFKARFRLSKRSVQYILANIEHLIRLPTNRNSAINPLQQLLITLRFYSSGNMLITAGDFGGVHKSTVSNIIKKVTVAICSLRQRYLALPTGNEIRIVQQNFYRIAAFPRVLLAIDCTHIKIQSPGGDNAEVFRNRKGYFSLNVQVACDSHLKFRDIVARWPGSTHDANIFNNSHLKARIENAQNNFILGDSGYPLSDYLMTPFLNPNTAAERLYNESQIRTRNVIERAFGVWKRRFPCLVLGLRLKLETVQNIIVATAILHNIAIEENEGAVDVNPEVAAIIDEVLPNEVREQFDNVVRNALVLNYFSRLNR